jgi:mono/diheme cytochrome c family protein
MLCYNKQLQKVMKISLHLNAKLWQLLLLLIVANFHLATAQTSGKEKQPPIPDDVYRIFQTSCISCHGDKGGRLPTSKLKFSRWSGYGANKQEEKAKNICSEMSKGKMPPKSARQEHPELIPTKDQIDMICKWAESLKAGKGKK